MQFQHEEPPEIGMIMQLISMHREHTRNAVNREEADSPAARKLSPE